MSSTPIRHDNIFVVGCQRSGTSVVWACLVAHPELKPRRGYDAESGYDPKEFPYFRNIFAARKQFGSPMYGWDVDDAYMKDLIELTVRHCCHYHGALNGRWVTANPLDGLHVAELLAAMPEIRVVNVIRHPLEVVWSAVHAPWLEGEPGTLEKRAEQAARHWVHFARIAKQITSGRFGDSVLLVRHDDFLRDPSTVAATITEHVGVSNDPAVAKQLGGPVFNSSFQNNADPTTLVEATRRDIFENGRFREIVLEVAAKEMAALGYRDFEKPRDATVESATDATSIRIDSSDDESQVEAMARICFVTYEIHPTTWGGAGVLLHHAAEKLLQAGHRVVFLLDIPKSYFDRFNDRDRLEFPNPDACVAFHVDELCADMTLNEEDVGNIFLWKALRFDHALARMLEAEPVDFVEFPEYCGLGYYALVAKLFGARYLDTVVGMRAHNSIELIDAHESTKPLDVSRHVLHGLERAGMHRSEVLLFPSRLYADAYYRERYQLDEEAIVVSTPPTLPFGQPSKTDDSEKNEIIYFGRIFGFKGVEQLVQASISFFERELERGGGSSSSGPLRCVLIGPDSRVGGQSYIAYLKKLIPERFAKRFEFTGHLDHETTRQRLSKALFAVFPNRFESFCYSMHEVYDAGVPLICTDIPAFRNVLTHDENALLFDGSTENLVNAMERLSADPALRGRLSRPYPIAGNPLGEFYESPHPARPIAVRDAAPVPILAVILVSSKTAHDTVDATVAAVQKSTAPNDEVVILRSVDDVPTHESDARASFSWLGRAWTPERADGTPMAISELRSLDAICVLRAGDSMDPDYLPMCRRALGTAGRPLAFAGSWSRDADGVLFAASFDVAPELYPFEYGGRLTRAVIRTTPGQQLDELFDPAMESYGEIAHLWRAVAAHGSGCLLPQPLLRTADDDTDPHHPEFLAYLVANVDDPQLLRRLSAMSVARPEPILLRADPEGTPAPGPAARVDITSEMAEETAWEMLNGTQLARMAGKKLTRKLSASLLGRKGGSPT